MQFIWLSIPFTHWVSVQNAWEFDHRVLAFRRNVYPLSSRTWIPIAIFTKRTSKKKLERKNLNSKPLELLLFHFIAFDSIFSC